MDDFGDKNEARWSSLESCHTFMSRRTWFGFLILTLFPVGLSIQGQQNAAVISVDAAHPGAAISPSMFGIFFEDINFGADGGLYPELVKNRSFEFQEPLTGWHEVLGFSSKGLDQSKGRTRYPHRRSAQPVQSRTISGFASTNRVRILEHRFSRNRS